MIRVLHIDDEAPIRLLARVHLEWEAGMEMIEAEDGLAGVQLAKRELPDLILLGRRARSRSSSTARSELRDIARGLELGAVDYITKQFNPLELSTRIRWLLERLERGERDELRREKSSELRALMGGAA